MAPRATPDAPDRNATDAPLDGAAPSLHETLAELFHWLFFYLSARADAFKYEVKRRMFIVWLIAVGVLAGAGAVVAAVVLLCEGICDGLSLLLHARWAGELLTGVLLLGGVALTARFFVRRLIEQSRAKIFAKYEAFRRRQQDHHG